MWAIIKKEVRTYFLSPIGYVFVGLFLLMASLFFYSEVLVTGSTMFSNIFYSLSTILIMIVPLLTMRMFSEERKEGTEQLLLTAPRSITSIVLGKFFAGLIVLIIAVAFTAIHYIILMTLGEPNLKTSLVTVFGFILLGAAFISFGMFASSITENQIISAIFYPPALFCQKPDNGNFYSAPIARKYCVLIADIRSLYIWVRRVFSTRPHQAYSMLPDVSQYFCRGY